MRAALASCLSAVLLSSCSGTVLFSCQETLLERVSSPDGMLSAIVMRYDCGATSSYTMEVSIVRQGSPMPAKGNALVFDRAPEYSSRLRPMWTSDADIVLAIPEGARVFVDARSVEGVSIKYLQVSAAAH